MLHLDASHPRSAASGGIGARLSSAVPDLVLSLDVEQCSATTKDCRLIAYSQGGAQ